MDDKTAVVSSPATIAASKETVTAGREKQENAPARPGWPKAAIGLSVVLLAVVAVILVLALLGIPKEEPLQMDVTLFRHSGNSLDHLQAGNRLRIGDRLSLDIKVSTDSYVYILNEDEEGNAFILFPLPNVVPTNPIQGNILHRLPGRRAGADVSWEVTSAGGRETFIVLASKEPKKALEKDLADFAALASERPVQYAAVSGQSRSALRGIGGLVESGPVTGKNEPGKLSQLVQAVSGQKTGSDDVRLWTIQLDNPPG